MLKAAAAEWQPALHHEFLHACGDGTVSPAAFNAWLQQDHQFVSQFKKFAEYVLGVAPTADRDLLRGGVAALDDELRWFEVLLIRYLPLKGFDIHAYMHMQPVTCKAPDDQGRNNTALSAVSTSIPCFVLLLHRRKLQSGVWMRPRRRSR